MAKYITLFISLFLATTNIKSETNKLQYSKHYTVSDGLSHTGITCLLEDSKGYVWIGTFDGLNRYDGYNFYPIKNSVGKKVLVSNRVSTLFEDSKGNIIVGTENGLSLYKYDEEKFVDLYSNPGKGVVGPYVRKIAENKDAGQIICVTNHSRVLVFDANYKLVKRHSPKFNNVKSKARLRFYDAVYVQNNQYLLASSYGLVSFNAETEEFNLVFKKQTSLVAFVKEVKKNIYLASSSRGLSIVKYNEQTKAFRVQKNILQDYRFNYADVGFNNSIWLSTQNKGLFKVSEGETFIDGKKVDWERFTLTDKNLKVSCIMASEKTGCWVGTTFNQGLFRFRNTESPFFRYQTRQNLKYEFKTDNITRVFPLDSNRVFVCALEDGLSLYNTKTKLFEPMPFNISPNMKSKVRSGYMDSGGDLWLHIGFQGLFRVKKNSKKLEKILSNDKEPFLEYTIRSFSEDKTGALWLGTRNEVSKMSFYGGDKNPKSVEYLSKNVFFKDAPLANVHNIYVDPQHPLLWVASESQGLYRVWLNAKKKLEDDKVTHYTKNKEREFSITSNFVSSVLRLSNGQLWVATERGGVCKVENSNRHPQFIPYSEQDGLSNHVVTGMTYDDDNNLWLSTNRGINKLDIKNNRFHIYGIDDGLPFETFKYGSAKLKNGYIVYFGFEGICYFNPKYIKRAEPLPKLEFGTFRIYNRIIHPGDTLNNRVVYHKSINSINKIELEHDENSISIELTSLHFLNPKNHLLQYQLLPVNKEWIEVASDQNLIQYSALRPGKYTLKARASNSLNQWTEVKELKIRILPPFWKTPLAFVIYVLLIALIVYVVIKNRLQIQALNHNIEIEQLEVDKVKEVNEAKLRFFSNISHEIKTPLTLIAGPVESLVRKYRNHGEISEKLSIVQRQSKHITRLIDQVHDFQRSDANMLKMDNSVFSFNRFITQLTQDFNYLAKSSNKSFVVKEASEDIFVQADKDKLEKIFNNLLNNAFKYTNVKDSIQLEYGINEGELYVFIKDTGRGIDKEDLPHVFERFYQSKKKYSVYTGGSGIGLAFSKRLVEMHYGNITAESELDVQTTMKVTLPIITTKVDELVIEKEKEVLEAGNIELNSEEMKLSKSMNIVSNPAFSDAHLYLVEDNNDMRLFVESTLSTYFKVSSFTNGQECLDAMEEEWPDLIVSDVLMPQLNGFELCKAVKSNVKTSHIPVVLLTACTSLDEQVQGLQEGADAYIKKPFDMQHLVTSIESILQNRQQLRERYNINYPLKLEKEEDSSKADRVFLEKLYELINENLDNQELDVDQLAKMMYFNRTNFYQKVKAITNQTPFELLKNYRITKAAELLVQEDVSVGEVIYMTGFKSRTHFNKLFKERFDVTPSKYASEAIKKFDED